MLFQPKKIAIDEKKRRCQATTIKWRWDFPLGCERNKIEKNVETNFKMLIFLLKPFAIIVNCFLFLVVFVLVLCNMKYGKYLKLLRNWQARGTKKINKTSFLTILTHFFSWNFSIFCYSLTSLMVHKYFSHKSSLFCNNNESPYLYVVLLVGIFIIVLWYLRLYFQRIQFCEKIHLFF